MLFVARNYMQQNWHVERLLPRTARFTSPAPPGSVRVEIHDPGGGPLPTARSPRRGIKRTLPVDRMTLMVIAHRASVGASLHAAERELPLHPSRSSR